MRRSYVDLPISTTFLIDWDCCRAHLETGLLSLIRMAIAEIEEIQSARIDAVPTCYYILTSTLAGWQMLEKLSEQLSNFYDRVCSTVNNSIVVLKN